MAHRLEVEFEILPKGRLWLRYQLNCAIDSLVLPEKSENERANFLWQTTCFELFLHRPGSKGYWEFNFAPSGQWAAYQFDGYRDGMSDWAVVAPEINCTVSDTQFALEAVLTIADILHDPIDAAFTAVVHEKGEVKSYWSAKHPAGTPDFHHKDCIAAHLAPPERI